MAGIMTLEEIANELSLNLGGKAPAPDRLKLWVNFAVQNLGSYVLFDELRVDTTIAIVDGTLEYAYPTDMLGVVTISIAGVKVRKARRLPTYEDVSPRQPTYYVKRGTKLVFWPEPDVDYTAFLEYVKTPAKLTASSDVSPFPPIWDPGLVQLATHHGLLALGRNDEADRWLGRFLGYASSRLKEEDISADVPHGGVNIAWTWDDVHEDPPHMFEE